MISCEQWDIEAEDARNSLAVEEESDDEWPTWRRNRRLDFVLVDTWVVHFAWVVLYSTARRFQGLVYYKDAVAQFVFY